MGVRSVCVCALRSLQNTVAPHVYEGFSRFFCGDTVCRVHTTAADPSGHGPVGKCCGVYSYKNTLLLVTTTFLRPLQFVEVVLEVPITVVAFFCLPAKVLHESFTILERLGITIIRALQSITYSVHT